MKHVLLFVLALLTLPSFSAAQQASIVGLEQLEVQPTELNLSGPRSSAQLVVSGKFADGIVRDLTRSAEYRASNQVTIDHGFVTPVGNGSGSIEVRVGGKLQTIKLNIQRFDESAPVSFRLETLAVLTKQGCNSGSCHGKPNGRGALELSLNAFDPAADERTLIRAPLLRFTHPLEPTESLLLKKPLLQIPHGGGKRLKPTDAAYAILRQWIEHGCQPDPATAPRCVKVEVFPPSGRVLKLDTSAQSSDHKQSPTQQQVRVVAHYSDGTQRDVTRIASFTVSHDRIARVDDRGLVTGLERGQTAVVVRYLDDIVSTYLTFVRDVPGFVWNNPPENNFVDQLVHQKLRQLQYLPSEDCDDTTFIRRLSLDVRGLLPSVAETTEFLADKSPTKRAALIDRFLTSAESARFWGLRMADLLRINRDKLSPERAAAYSQWVFDSVARNQPYDEFVRTLLTGQGDTDEAPAANFFRTTTDTNTVTETVAQLFMGSRVMCAQCHNHPYESWTQDNYYQIGAAFHEVDRNIIKADGKVATANPKAKRKKRDEARDSDMVVALSFGRAMSNPRTGVTQKPWPTDIERQRDEDKRLAFARWLTARGNPFFARVAVNRIWTHVMGRGIVEPIDDFRSSNPAVNVELLDALAKDFEDSGFDRRHVLRRILNSRTYQRRSETNPFNETDEILNSHARTRLLTAEQMQDAIRLVCEGPNHLDELKAELTTAEDNHRKELEKQSNNDDAPSVVAASKRIDEAKARIDGYYMTQQPYPHLTPFLTAFGQPPRETACACERREEANLDQALQLMNSDLIRNQVNRAASRIEKLPDDALLTEIYVAALSRSPTEVERTKLTAYLAATKSRRQAIEDILWAVLNTNEFMFQH